MQVGEMLTVLLERDDRSKNSIICEAGIDRSSFYKILKGARAATPAQLTRILDVLDVDEEERKQILDAYEREQIGEERYRQREEVRRFLNGLSTQSTQSTLETSAAETLRRFVEREIHEGAGHVLVFLPVGSRCMTQLFTLIAQNQRGDDTYEICALLANEESRDVRILRELSGWFPYLSAQTVQFHAYTMWETTRGLEALPFPYYILGEHSVLLIDGDETQLIEMQQSYIVQAYLENCMIQMTWAEEIASTETGYEPILQFFMSLWQEALEHQDEVYLLTPRPCLWLCSTDEMVRKYMHDEGFVRYGQVIRSLNMREFTTRSGMQQFLDESRLSEAGFDIPIAPEDMKVVQNRIQQNTNDRTFFLNEERIHLPQDWQVVVVANKIAVFVPYQTSAYMMCVRSSAVVAPLSEWCESRARERIMI